MDKPQLHSSLCERFPERSEQIGQLAQQDPEFAEACSDYEELRRWLAAHDHEACSPEFASALNHLLLAELEVDLLGSLQAVDRCPGRQVWRWSMPLLSPTKMNVGYLFREAAPRQTTHLKE